MLVVLRAQRVDLKWEGHENVPDTAQSEWFLIRAPPIFHRECLRSPLSRTRYAIIAKVEPQNPSCPPNPF